MSIRCIPLAAAALALSGCAAPEEEVMRLSQSGEHCIAHMDGRRFNFTRDEDELAAHLRDIAPSAQALRLTTYGLVPYRCIGEATAIARAEGFMDVRT